MVEQLKGRARPARQGASPYPVTRMGYGVNRSWFTHSKILEDPYFRKVARIGSEANSSVASEMESSRLIDAFGA